MKIMGVNLSHDGSVCVIEDGKIIFYQEEERVTHQKHTTGVLHSFAKGIELEPNHVIFVGAFPYDLNAEMLLNTLLFACGKQKHFESPRMPKAHWMKDHHLAHATVAFNNSKFDEAAVLVIDGAGQAFYDEETLYRESETMYIARQTNIIATHKNLIKQFDKDQYEEYQEELGHMPYFSKCSQDLSDIGCNYTVYDRNMSLGKLFSAVGIKIFGSYHNAGKVMGLSAYGSDNPEHPRAFDEEGANPAILDSDLSNEDLAYRTQTDSFEFTARLIRKALSFWGNTNICLSGGYFLNCVNNYKYLKEFPDINFYVEPNSSDSGTSIGAAQYLYTKLTEKSVKPINLLYLGEHANYDIPIGVESKEVSYKDVAQLLADQNIVALYQGKEESGPRALGNRSILYDPRDPDGRDKVNKIKKREFFRPFAGSVLVNKASEWFDLATLSDSPHMMYAVETLKDKKDIVPALQHNDGTSRIQTVSIRDNAHYYHLIREFGIIAGVPMLLNTSFNLAGDTLVRNMDDAIRTCKESGIKYLYCPEIKRVILL